MCICGHKKYVRHNEIKLWALHKTARLIYICNNNNKTCSRAIVIITGPLHIHDTVTTFEKPAAGVENKSLFAFL